MRTYVLGFDQEKALEMGMTVQDLFILEYILLANGSSKMKHIVKDDVPYVWLQHKKILEDLPILNVTPDYLKNYIQKLKDKGWIQSDTIHLGKGRGSSTYYRVTDEIEQMHYTYKENRGNKNNTSNDDRDNKNVTSKEDRGNKNVTSYNSLHNNSTYNTLSKERVSETEPLTKTSLNSLDDYNSHAYSEDDIREERKRAGKESRRVLVEDEKPKKKSLYVQCMEELDKRPNFTVEEKEALKLYLPVRLALKDKPLVGVNMWKGLLNSLDKMHGDRVRIVEYSTARGYAAFFEDGGKNKCYTKKGDVDGKVDPSVFGETEKHQQIAKKATLKDRQEVFASGVQF